jgi:DNA-binding MarR family transcriptional regulator
MSDKMSKTKMVSKAEAGGLIDLSSLTEVIGYRIRWAQLAVFDDFIRSFADHNIRPTQYGVLTTIGGNPGSSQAAIAESLGIKRSNFVKLVDDFEKRGFVERRVVVLDRRTNALYLTEAGQEAIEQLREIHEAHEARIGALIGSPEDRKLFLEQLARLSALRQSAVD